MKINVSKFILAILLIFILPLNFSYSEKKLTPTVKVEVPDFTYREEKPPAYNPTIAFLQAILYLILIIIGIYVVVFILKFFFSKRGMGGLISPYFIKVLESAYLAPHASIHIVEVAGKVLVVGISERAISLLCEITDQETISKILQSKTTVIPFQKHLASFISKFSQKEEIDSSLKEAKEYLQNKLEYLKNLQKE